MGFRQCLSLSVVQLKGKNCWKPHCRNGVVDMFGLCPLWKNGLLPTKIRGRGASPAPTTLVCCQPKLAPRHRRRPPNAQAPEDAICVKWEKYWKSKFHLSGASQLLRFLPTDLYMVGWICGVNMLSIIRYFDGCLQIVKFLFEPKTSLLGLSQRKLFLARFEGQQH